MGRSPEYGGIEREKSVKKVCSTVVRSAIFNKAVVTTQTKWGAAGRSTITSLICTTVYTGLSKSPLQPNAGWQRGILFNGHAKRHSHQAAVRVSKVSVHVILSDTPDNPFFLGTLTIETKTLSYWLLPTLK